MALPVPSGDRGHLRVTVLGFPVSMHVGFLLLGALFAFSGGLTVAEAAVWIAVVTVSVLVHELGHALVMRAAGAQPSITLYALGGVTQGVLPVTTSRARRLAISLAGPGAGLTLGLAAFAVFLAVPVEPGSLADFALGSAVFANVAWGIVNLLPMLPLDGGHVLLTLLPGDEDKRFRLASGISIATGVLATLLALSVGSTFGAVLAVYFTVGNLAAVRGPRPDRTQSEVEEMNRLLIAGDTGGAAALARQAAVREPRLTGVGAQLTAAALLEEGRPQDARDELLALPPGSVEPTLEAAVLLATGNEALGRERMRAVVEAGPSWWAIPALVAVLLARGEDPVRELGGIQDPELRRRVAGAAGRFADPGADL